MSVGANLAMLDASGSAGEAVEDAGELVLVGAGAVDGAPHAARSVMRGTDIVRRVMVVWRRVRPRRFGASR
jgi:hypothetical protein